MDINSLSEVIIQTIAGRESLVLPSIGLFTASYVPASFSDKGYTINPPYRELSFAPDPNASDDILYREWASRSGISEDDARKESDECLNQIVLALQKARSIEFPHLGKLRLTKEGEMFFVSDPDALIYPEAFALEPVYLKNRELQKGIVQAEKPKIEKPATPMKEPDMPAVRGTEELETPVEAVFEEEKEKENGKSWIAVVVLIVIIVALLAVIALRLLGTYAPDFIDKILYSPEELQKLHSSITL